MENIPFLNLKNQYLSIKDDIDSAIQNVLDRASFIKGPDVKVFEEAFAKYLDASHCIGVANGTDALIISMKALGIGPGDEVITVPNTFIATVEAIVARGAIPVLVDIDYTSYTMDPKKITDAITEKTAAIIPVHLYGMPCDMDPILKVAQKNDLYVICDGAQAHGARYHGESLVKYCHAITYSFYPGKNLGAYGDAGAIVTNNDQLAEKVRLLADHGRAEKYSHNIYGLNSRLDTIQAAVLNVKLPNLDNWNARRSQIANMYNQGLKEIPEVICPTVPAYATPVWHVYVIRVQNRDGLQGYLKDCGIQTGIHYPIPIPDQPAAIDFIANCNRQLLSGMAQELLSLPICPEMTKEMVKTVIDKIRTFYN